MNPVINEFSSSDRQDAKSLILNLLKDFGFEYSPIYDFDLEDPYKHYIEKGGMFYVLKVNNKVIGTVAIINKGKTAELKRLYVDTNYQGKKFGSMLLDRAIQFCKDNGFTKLEFETNKKFKKAHLLYQRRGFKIVKEDDRSYYMEKNL
ncbi:MAG: GNAT family N-acetyltransferase [Patescibacteria group bacterium]